MTSKMKPSRAGSVRRDPTLADWLPAEIAAHLRTASLRWLHCNGQPYLAISGHRPFACPKPRARGRFLGGHGGREFYEETTTLLLSYLIGRLRPSVFFDVGAAKGYFMRVAASHATHAPALRGFEMQPELFDGLSSLVESSALGSDAAAIHAALTDRHVGEAEFSYTRSRIFETGNEADAVAPRWWKRAEQMLRGKPRRPVRARALVTSLDHIVRTTGEIPDIVKMDVEGYEGRVIAGALETFRKQRPVLVLELHREKRLRFGWSRQDVAGLLLDLDYRAFLLTDHHDRCRCEIVEVDHDHPLLRREETDLLLFVPGPAAKRAQ